MLDIKYIRENIDTIKDGVVAKQYDSSIVDELLSLDETRRKLVEKVDQLRSERNAISKMRNDSSLEKAKQLKVELKKLEPQLKEVESKFTQAMRNIPNIPEADVKIGKNNTENEVISTWGTPRTFDFSPRDHVELGEIIDGIDIKRATKVSGARFTYLKREVATLEFALIQYAMKVLQSEYGFIPVIPPVLIKKESMQATGHFEHGGAEDMFVLDKDELVLVGTAEQSIAPMHMGEVLDKKDLPLRYAGFSTCFRREAGSYGQDTRGILRVHQFDKVEMFSITTPELGNDEHERLLHIEEKLFQDLEIPYQVVKICSGDLGMPASRKYDIEAWIPSQGVFREVTSTSTTTDFQSRRLNVKYSDGKKTQYVHMLNGTAFAIGRTLIAILENYQQKNGSIQIPKVLRPLCGFDLMKNKIHS